MGGFVSRETGKPITTFAQLTEEPGYLSGIQETPREDIIDKSKGDALSKGIALLQGLVHCADNRPRGTETAPLVPVRVLQGTRAPIRRVNSLQTPRPPIWSRLSETIFFGPIQGTYAHYDPRSNSVIPAFWSSHDEPPLETALAAMLVGIVFGAIHCAAWNVSFLSPAERILWRVSAVMVAGYPVLLAILHGVLGVALYAMFRIVLIVLPLIALRSVDKGLLIDVDWTVYIPHL
ncbi:hypothetical protein B0H14DRAFT_3866109 [Mycena olivaceomarginata]|nr:hypothetical protein B0H14DRAFT_3866109 [Mycena olivaceomarginata]